MLNILMLVFNSTGKGTYWRAYHLGRKFVEFGHQVTLIVTSERNLLRVSAYEADGIQIVEVPDLLPGSLRSGWDLWNVINRIAWMRGKRFDIVHAFESRPTVIFPALTAQRHGAKLILDWADWLGTGGALEQRPNPLVRFILRPVETFFEEHYRSRADGSTVICNTLLQKAIDLGVKSEKILLLRNGADMRFQTVETPTIRKELGLAEDSILIGFAGGTYTEDAILMAASINRVWQREPRVRLMLIDGFNRPLEKWVQKPEAIIRVGRISPANVYRYLSACDLCWLPLSDNGTNRGRWPFKVTVYMTAGKAVVTTAVGDLVDIVKDFGIITPPNPDEFAEATLNLLKDPEKCRELGRLAHSTAKSVYNWDVLAIELEKFYQRILSSTTK